MSEYNTLVELYYGSVDVKCKFAVFHILPQKGYDFATLTYIQKYFL